MFLLMCSEQVGVHYELSEEEKFYRNALTRMPDGPSALEEAYNAVKEIVSEVEQYVKVRSIWQISRWSLSVCVETCCSSPAAFLSSGVVTVPVLVGHAGRKHLQSLR